MITLLGMLCLRSTRQLGSWTGPYSPTHRRASWDPLIARDGKHYKQMTQITVARATETANAVRVSVCVWCGTSRFGSSPRDVSTRPYAAQTCLPCRCPPDLMSASAFGLTHGGVSPVHEMLQQPALPMLVTRSFHASPGWDRAAGPEPDCMCIALSTKV